MKKEEEVNKIISKYNYNSTANKYNDKTPKILSFDADD
jgi:hypothetical protein